jgi:hypothetical protein
MKKLASLILVTTMLLLLLSLTACSGEAEKVVVKPKPLTKEQVMAKVSERLKKQTKLPTTQYDRKETLINGWAGTQFTYVGDHEYFSRDYDDRGYDAQTYQLPGYQYERNVYEKGEQVEWKKAPFDDSFQEIYFKTKTTNGTVEDLKAQTYLTILQGDPKAVQMKETAKTYEFDFTITDHPKVMTWLQPYIQNSDGAIDPTELKFTKYHTKIVIDKKTFAPQSIDNEVYFTRETLNLDNGEKGVQNLDIQIKIKYPSTKKLEVPKEVVKEGNKNDPFKLLQ